MSRISDQNDTKIDKKLLNYHKEERYEYLTTDKPDK